MENDLTLHDIQSCPAQYALAVRDTLNVISGKWKLPILGSLMFEKKRFTEIQNNVPKITPRMLSRELKDLELNGVIIRKVYDTTPVRVEYELTDSGRSIRGVLDKMIEWGLEHRKSVMSK